MQFVKGVPYFCQGVNKIKQYPYLTKNIACNILVIGEGICGAECNPYLLEKQFIENASNQSNIYENTTIVDITRQEQHLIARTTYGETIKAKNIVLATGFDHTLINNNIVCDKFVTYTIVTKTIKNLEWYNNALVQDYLDPYHYMRILPDNRIIYGGEDFDCPNDNIDEKKVQKKYVKLEKDLKKMLESFVSQIEVEYRFCGVFGSTENNLGYIGYSGTKGVYYFYSCGANGIINTTFGIDVLPNSLGNKSNKFTKIFSPLREK